MATVFRCYVEKREGFDVEAQALFSDLRHFLGLSKLTSLRLFQRYDLEGLDDDAFQAALPVVLSEPMSDRYTLEQLPALAEGTKLLCYEALPGQFDQRADSCAQCIQMLVGGSRPLVRAARILAVTGLGDEDFARLAAYIINPVECGLASLDKPETLQVTPPPPETIQTVDGFADMSTDELQALHTRYGLAMDLADLGFLQEHFRAEGRAPTETELRVLDTYWSDHCRHTTFLTHLDKVEIEDPRASSAYKLFQKTRRALGRPDSRPVTLMEIATTAMKHLRQTGKLPKLDESEEINACTVHADVLVDGEKQDYLLLFKNETHNHPTEIEPFGGAATCIGGAIRDPLSGRAYVYQAMRITGSGDPRAPLSSTLPGKLPQRKLTTTAAAGYSSYGNQIGLATGFVHEIYHPGYVAKRLEIGAVVGAAPAAQVVREVPLPGDVVILLGGRTGRDGIGGATGSSKSHSTASVSTCAAEVQKGNAPEERKLQRLMRNPEACRMIRRCNDFGAGGVAVAVGELAEGLSITLDAVPKKYEGLGATELAISESQERMAVVVAQKDVEAFRLLADKENLEATQIAVVTEEPRLVMRWNGQPAVDLPRSLMASNGVPKHARAHVAQPTGKLRRAWNEGTLEERLLLLLSDLNFCSQRGLVQRFDNTIGAATVLMPFGGKHGLTPTQVMAAKFPVTDGACGTCSVMSYAFDPYLTEADPFEGGRRAVIESVAKLVAAGCRPTDVYLTLQEYFPKLREDATRWGLPLSALLGAFEAQCGLECAAIGGKDSMSGTFQDMDVPPTLVSFAITTTEVETVLSPEFKGANHPVLLFAPAYNSDGSVDYDAMRALWTKISDAMRDGTILSAYACSTGGVMGALTSMALGGDIGFVAENPDESWFHDRPGAIVCECLHRIDGGVVLGTTSEKEEFQLDKTFLPLSAMRAAWEAPLSWVFPVRAPGEDHGSTPVYPMPLSPDTTPSGTIDNVRDVLPLPETAAPLGVNVSFRAAAPPVPMVPAITSKHEPTARPTLQMPRPRAVIPVFPGTNCEDDTAAALTRAGARPEIIVVRNMTPDALEASSRDMERALRDAQMLVIPGGFSAGDEPDGSGKFIAAFFRQARMTEAVRTLLFQGDGLILGICNGFQALIKLGLLPFGDIRTLDENCPTLSHNIIGRHQSKYAHCRVASKLSPWLLRCGPGECYTVPMSHGEGRFVAPPEVLDTLVRQGQVAFQYCDKQGRPSMDTEINPNGSLLCIESITSPDGRVLGKMGHTERFSPFVARNIHGNKFQPLFEGGVDYFRL